MFQLAGPPLGRETECLRFPCDIRVSCGRRWKGETDFSGLVRGLHGHLISAIRLSV